MPALDTAMSASRGPSLLVTKLNFPQVRRAFVPRPRLTARLQEGLQGPLTLIAAPAGSGKTTLLAEWLVAPEVATRPTPCWLALDKDDNDPARFLLYLAAALDTLQPGWMENPLAMLASPQLPSVETAMTALINAISQNGRHFPHGCALVLDDYHVIETPAIHEGMTFLLDHLPPALHLVLLTRADPPLPLSRLRARGHLTEIRARHLRFTFDEIAAFLQQVMGLSLTAEDIAALETRSEGWIAGLQLAALSLQGREDASDFVAAFAGSHHYIVDYLVEEVLARQPPAVREFLLRTSILERLSGPLCDAVRYGNAPSESAANGQTMLETLERANLFVVPLDGERRWYRYHHLFAEALHARLCQAEPEVIPVLRRRAAVWCECHDLMDEAITYALAAEDLDHAARLFHKNQLQVIYDRNLSTLSRWLRAFPEAFIRNDPWMCVAQAHILWAIGQRVAVGSYAQSAQDALIALRDAGTLAEDDLAYVALWGEALTFQSLAALTYDDAETAAQLAEEATAYLSQPSLSRCFALGSLYSAYNVLGDIERVIPVFLEAIALTRALNYPSMHATSVYSLAQILGTRGELHRAAALCEEALSHSERVGHGQLFYYGIVHVGLADVLYEWNRLDEAEARLNMGLVLMRRGGASILLPAALPTFAALKRVHGGPRAALAALDDMERECASMDPNIYRSTCQTLRLLYRAELGELAEAPDWLAALKQDEQRRPMLTKSLRMAVAVRLLLALNRLDEALSTLDRMERVSEAQGYAGLLIYVLVMQARAHALRRDEPRALRALRRALALAEPEGYARVFIDEGVSVAALLRHLATPGSYAARLLAACETAVSSQPGASLQPLIEPLSARELEILALIAEGRTNQEIAAALIIAIGTVKRHTANIFGKLGVKNRTEAVAQARSLRLLQ